MLISSDRLCSWRIMRQSVNLIKQLKQARHSLTAGKPFQWQRQAIRQHVNSPISMSKHRTILLQRGRGAFYDFITSNPFLGQAIKYTDSLQELSIRCCAALPKDQAWTYVLTVIPLCVAAPTNSGKIS